MKTEEVKPFINNVIAELCWFEDKHLIAAQDSIQDLVKELDTDVAICCMVELSVLITKLRLIKASVS